MIKTLEELKTEGVMPNSIYNCDCLEAMQYIKSKSIDLVITSPPYWSLRTYKSDPVIWGGDEKCEHRWVTKTQKQHSGRGDSQKGAKYSEQASVPDFEIESNFCSLCSAWKGELGLEPNFNLYIQHLVSVFDEVKRVLKKEGSCWVNIGDSYAGSGKGIGTDRTKCKEVYTDEDIKKTDWSQVNIPAKCRLLIPERFAIEMVSKGWILRQEIIWVKQVLDVKISTTKGSAMPTSVKDRFNCTHEKLYHFVKSKKYYFNLDAVRLKNQVVGVTDFRTLKDFQNYDLKTKSEDFSLQGKQSWARPNYDGKFAGSDNPEAFGSPRARTQRKGKISDQEELDPRYKTGSGPRSWQAFKDENPNSTHPSGKNLPSVWLISPEPTREKHFAAYPTKLCHIPILTTCPKDGIVLDPFCGTNTTGKVAEKLGRSWVGIDIQPQYVAIAKRKLAQKEMGLS